MAHPASPAPKVKRAEAKMHHKSYGKDHNAAAAALLLLPGFLSRQGGRHPRFYAKEDKRRYPSMCPATSGHHARRCRHANKELPAMSAGGKGSEQVRGRG